MKLENSCDYETKIKNFMLMTETGDQEVAMKYLSSVNWDETAAVNKFYSRINQNLKNSNQNINSNNNNNNNNEGFFSSLFSPFFSIFGSCLNNNKSEINIEDDKIFDLLPNKITDSTRFKQLINRRIGIIIFYDRKNIQFLNNLISHISRNTTIMNLLRQNFIILPLLSTTEKAEYIQKTITDSYLINPSFIFCYNFPDNNFLNKKSVIYMLQSENIKLDDFLNAIYKSLEKIGMKKNYDKSYDNLTDGEILEKQREEIENLENDELKQKEIENKVNEIQKEIENKANEIKKEVVDEPSKDDPDCTIICFRYPDGEKRIDRRFLKSHKIQNLYDYVTSLGKEIYTEEDYNSFSLYQAFPPKKFENMENTLEEEGLFPNAIIQIKEE